MASDAAAPSLPTPTSSDHEPVENKVKEEIKLVEPETATPAKKNEEEGNVEHKELPSESTALPKSGGEAELPAIDVKQIDDVPVVDVPVKSKTELEKDSIPDSQTSIVQLPVAVVVDGEPIAQTAIESVPKEAEEQQEQTNTVDVPAASNEAIKEPQGQSEVLPIKESEPVETKRTQDSAASKDIDVKESKIPEDEVKPEEQSEVAKVEEPKTDEAAEKPQEPLEVLPVKSEAVVVKDPKDSEASPKEGEKTESEPVVPEVEVKPEEQSEVNKQVDPEEESTEGIVRTQEPVEVPIEESEVFEVTDSDDLQASSKQVDVVEAVAPETKEVIPDEESKVGEQVEKPEEQSTESVDKTVAEKLIDDSLAVSEADRTESVDPEVKIKPEEELEVDKENEKTEAVVPKVEVKAEDEFETMKEAEKPATVVPEVEVKLEEQSKVTEQVETKQTDDNPGKVVSASKDVQADLNEDTGESPLPDIGEKAGADNEKKETIATDIVIPEKGKNGEEKEEVTVKTEEEKIATDVPNKELAQPTIVGDAQNSVSNVEVTEKSFEGEKTNEGIATAVENKDEKSVKESQGSGLEVKEKEEKREKTNEEKPEQEKVDEIAKTEAQNLETSNKDLQREVEVSVKPTQKQSNNILTKVKQSLVKAKKAIIGKSPTPKTISSNTKGDIKVDT